jgi:hypothetical protein
VAAQEEELPSGWALGLSFFASFMAIGCSIVAVLELSIYPKTFWFLHVLAALLLLVSYWVTGFRGMPFWITTFCALTVMIIATAVVFAKSVASKFLRL